MSACICAGWNQLGLRHRVALQHPGRRFLIEERPERRDEREDDQDAQNRAHAIDRFVRMRAARTRELHRSAGAAETDQQSERRHRRDDESEFAGQRERAERQQRADDCDDQAGPRLPRCAR